MEHLVWISLLLAAGSCWAEDPYLLMVQQNEITRVSLDGQTLTAVLPDLGSPDALTVDYDNGFIFFTDIAANSVYRANIDGSAVVRIIENLGEPSDVAVDTQMTRVYWSDSGRGIIGSCDYDGESRTPTLVSGLNQPSSIVLDITKYKIYWLDWVSRDGSKQYVLGSVSPDGTGVDKELKNIGGWPDTLTQDPTTGRLLWSDTFQSKVFSIDPEKLADSADLREVAAGQQIKGLAVHGQALYFTELFNMRLMRVALDTAVTEELEGGLTFPRRLALVKPPTVAVITAPRLRMGMGKRGAVKFVCVLPHPETEYLVTWRSVPGDVVSRPVTGQTDTLEMSNEEGFRLGVRDSMTCIVQTRTMDQANGQTVLGEEIGSNVQELRAEVKVMTTQITVTEGQGVENVFVEVAGPPFFSGEDVFYLEMTLKRENEELRGHNGKVIDQVVVQAQPGQRTSKLQVNGSNWFKKHAFPIKAVFDGKNGGNTRRTLEIWRTNARHSERRRRKKRDIYKMKVGQTKIMKLGIPGGICSAINDPHMTSINGNRYEMHLRGEFILYKHPVAPYQINLGLQNCLFGVPLATCVCAVYIRVHNDVWVFHQCTTVHTRWSDQTREPLHVFLFGRNDSGTIIYKQSDGEKHTVDMGRGRQVRLESDRGYLAVHFTPNGEDFNQGPLGLCGVYDLDRNNDFTTSGGKKYDALKREELDQFNESWRAKGEAKLSRGVKVTVKSEENTVYCSVLDTNTDSAQELCHENMDIAYPVSPDKAEYAVVKESEKHDPDPNANADVFVGEVRRKRRSLDAPSSGFDPFAPIIADVEQPVQYATWPTAKGRTEQDAIDICSTSINDHRGVQLCSVMQNDTFQDAIDGCVLDIKSTDDLEWVDDAISGILERCDIFTTQVNTTAPDNAPPQLLPNGVNKTELRATMCPKNCSGNGVCSEAACSCDAGFMGADCLLRLTDPPNITVLLETFCDLSKRSCAEAIVYGEKFHNRETLTCHLQEYTLGQPLPVGNSFTVKAEFTKFDQIACPLPDRRPYIIQASNDGVNVAKRRLLFAPLDLSCMECGMTSLENIISAGCTLKASTCLIDGQCYADMVVNPASSCDVCDPSVSQDEWTKVKGNAECRETEHTTLVIALCAVAGVLLILVLVGGVTFLCLRYRLRIKTYNIRAKSNNPSS